MYNRIFLGGFLVLAIVFACKKHTADVENFGEGEPIAGSCTTYDETSYAFTHKVNGLTTSESQQFFVGNSFFNQNWVESPSSTTARDGLGPLFNSKSCAGCHFRDGRGKPEGGLGLLFRLGTPSSAGFSGSIADMIYGNQLQDRGISTVTAEGQMVIQYTETIGYYPDGTAYSLRVPTYSISGQNYGSLMPTVRISPRIAQQMVGLGLLELIPESDILRRADAHDMNRDGISGRPNYVHDVLTNGTSLGRFGWKANVPSIPQQVAGAFNGDLGITSSLFPYENHTLLQTACIGLPNGGSPEIPDDDLSDVILYSRTLAVPAQRTPSDPNVRAGRRLFGNLKCASCHTPRFVTGSAGAIQALKGVAIYPYTDLLLHDMGEGLADNLPDFKANGREWRTPPLWGIGMIQTVNGHTFLLHDGRARNIEEAILWHGGEAEKSKARFMQLSKKEREQVLKFLQSL